MSDHPRAFGVDHYWFLAIDNPEHAGRVCQNQYAVWAECSCGWATKELPTEDRAAVIFRKHERFQPRTVGPVSPSAEYESLARADARVCRCPECGDLTWDNECNTCMTLAQRQARRTTQREKASA